MTAGITNGGSMGRRGICAETYLDWNATAPLRPQAVTAMSAVLASCGNPSSVHRRGRAAWQAVERARESVAAMLGGSVEPSRIVFVSGGTEANHLALIGAGRERVLVSAIEHHSVLDAVADAETIPVDSDGVVALDALDRLLAKDPRPTLVSVMLANNETGVIQPVAEVAALARKYGALFHCDAVQAAGKISLDAAAIGAGGQERGRRAGTENLPGIAGFAAAAAAESIAIYDRVRGLRDSLEAGIASAAPNAVIMGAGALRLPNTSAIAMPGVAAEIQVIALDLEGVMVSAGAACSAGKVGPSHVLAAMGVEPDLAASTIRVSLGWSSSEADIAHFLKAWTALYHRRGGDAGGRRAA